MARATFSAAAFDEMSKAVFSQAFERASAQAVVDPLPPGHIALERKDRGGLYAKWRRVGADSKPLPSIYLGAEGGSAHAAALDRLADLQALSTAAQTLRKLGYAGEDNAAAVVLAALANAGFFAGGGTLVGTRAFRCLTNHLGYKVIPTLATHDVDVARDAKLSLAAPFPSGGMKDFLKATGLRFSEVPGLGRTQPVTSWAASGRDLKLDLLTPASRTRMAFSTVKIPELGAHATALPFLDYLTGETIEAMSVGKTQLVPVRVPTPARFCWHKLAVSVSRPAGLAAKAEKDAAQAACLAACLSFDGMDELGAAAQALPQPMRAKAKAAFPRFARQFGREYLAVLEEMGRALGVKDPLSLVPGGRC